VAENDLRHRRPALDPALILSELAKGSSNWRDIDVVSQVTSTNDIAISRLQTSPNVEVFAVTADEQLNGRGRLQREWSSAFGAGIALSIAIPTTMFGCQLSAIPLLVGVAVNTCLLRHSANAKLKWPNDLMLVKKSGDLGKVGGILVQRENSHVVIGIGINSDLDLSELPTDIATSLTIEGLLVSREVLIAQILTELELTISSTTGDWLDKYASMSCTLGCHVTVTNLDQEVKVGLASSISPSGALILETEGGQVEVIAGDVARVRT
jgi:BirA family biotin operon repressor/biotin-[acetyl-CoA-carboxylase] ligase